MPVLAQPVLGLDHETSGNCTFSHGLRVVIRPARIAVTLRPGIQVGGVDEVYGLDVVDANTARPKWLGGIGVGATLMAVRRPRTGRRRR